jgi:hypothetical protein
MPQVVVYKDLFDSEYIYKFIDILKRSENYTKKEDVVDPEDSSKKDSHGKDPEFRRDFGPINTWVPWYTYGIKTFLNNSIVDEFDTEDIKFLYEFKNKFNKILLNIFNDYRKEWRSSAHWPDYIDDWDIQGIESENGKFVFSVIEVLKHNISPEKEFAINFHTDSHEHRIESPRQQQIITFTFYLNDNYEGGEVQFIDELNQKLITYKPKLGDITVFPAGPPYWHSAVSVKSGENKYFFRLFMLWNHPGTEWWWEGFNKHGKEKWEIITNELAAKDLNSGVRDRKIIRDGKISLDSRIASPFYIKEEDEVYIDGRTL